MSSAWKLIIEDDAGKQIVVPFARDVITIGRKEGNTIRLTERNVSRFHAKLDRQDSQIVVEDLGSFNGIKLNGDRISGKVIVNEGDSIQIGDYHLAFHAQNAAATKRSGEGPVAGHKMALADSHLAVDDDEFAGDTQRWEPPADGPSLSVGGLATQEEGALRDETVPLGSRDTIERGQRDTVREMARELVREPMREPVELANAGGAHAFGAGDTQRLEVPNGAMPFAALAAEAPASHSDFRPPRTPEFTGNTEETVKQAAAPAPISGVSASVKMPPPQPSTFGAGFAPPLGAPPLASLIAPVRDARETRPERAAPAASNAAALVQAPVDKRNVGAPSSSPAALPATPQAQAGDQRNFALSERTEAIRPAPSAADDVSVARLVVVNTVFCGSTFRLHAAAAVIGRTEDNDITIEHRSVSRNHAKVERDGDRIRIVDLQSANGILLNGEETNTAVLKSGDIVELGRVRMRFVAVGERFSVSADEIERARVQDTQGNDEFDGAAESGTGLTSARVPKLRASRNNRNVVAAAVGVAVVLGLIAMWFWRRAQDEDAPARTALSTEPRALDVNVDAAPPQPVSSQPVSQPVSSQPVSSQPVSSQPVSPPAAALRDEKPLEQKSSALAVSAADDTAVTTREPAPAAREVTRDKANETRGRGASKRGVGLAGIKAQADARDYEQVVQLALEFERNKNPTDKDAYEARLLRNAACKDLAAQNRGKKRTPIPGCS